MTRVPTLTRVNDHIEPLIWYIPERINPELLTHHDLQDKKTGRRYHITEES